MSVLFTEDAEKFWSKQERLWEEEKAARERLMDDVVYSWKGQIQHKIEGINNMSKLLCKVVIWNK